MPVYNYTTLDDPSSVGFTTIGVGINSAGQVVGAYSNNSGGHGFLYSNGAYLAIDDPLATAFTNALGIMPRLGRDCRGHCGVGLLA